MEASSLEQLIINLARQKVARPDVIRMLVSQGYSLTLIERTLNELYYAGKLSFDMASSLDETGIKTIDDTILPKAPSSGVSKMQRVYVWVRLHIRATIVISGSFLSICAAIIGGIQGYQTSPTVIVNRALAQLIATPAVAYRIATTTLPIDSHNSIIFSSQGIIAKNPTPRVTADIFFQENNKTPWNLTLIHTDGDILYMYIQQGPSPYSFLYNKWIQFSVSKVDSSILSDFGLGDLISHSGFFKSFSSNNDPVTSLRAFASTPGSYAALLEKTDIPVCTHAYAVAFNTERVTQVVSTLINPDIKIISALTQTPWNVCIDSNNFISHINIPIATQQGLKNILIDIAVPQTLPSFNIDTPATPLKTVEGWKEGK